MSAATVSVVLDGAAVERALVDDVQRGLGAHPRTLPPRWLYDDAGAELYNEITRLPEYYPFRAERAILDRHADEIALASGADSLIELGSGTSEKTRLLLDAFAESRQLRRFTAVDVAEPTLRHAVTSLSQRYPDVAVGALVGDFTLHLGHLPREGRRMVLFLGGTIGNLYLEERRAFLGALSDVLAPGDTFLLGTDLVKDADRLVAAYHDPAGVTEAFVRNALRSVNAQLGADFDLDGFSYVPFWDGHMERMDLRLRAEVPQQVRVPGADLVLDLAAGEEIRIEISTKFRVSSIAAELEGADFDVQRVWTDPPGDYALTLARKK